MIKKITGALMVSLSLVGCMGTDQPGPGGTQEFLKGNDTKVFTLGSLIAVGDTYNITDSSGAAIGSSVGIPTEVKRKRNQTQGVMR